MVKLAFALAAFLVFLTGSAEAGALRDPTAPLFGAVKSAAQNSDKGSLRLQAVMRGYGRDRAVINGRKCLGYVLISLTKSSAIMVAPQGDERIVLSLYTSGKRETKNEDK